MPRKHKIWGRCFGALPGHSLVAYRGNVIWMPRATIPIYFHTVTSLALEVVLPSRRLGDVSAHLRVSVWLATVFIENMLETGKHGRSYSHMSKVVDAFVCRLWWHQTSRLYGSVTPSPVVYGPHYKGAWLRVIFPRVVASRSPSSNRSRCSEPKKRSN